jgi:fucose permease
MPALPLACLAYLGAALPASTLGLLWPSARLSLHQPVGALGFLLAFGITATVISSAVTGRALSRVRMGPVLALGAVLTAAALALEARAPAVWEFAVGMVVFGLGYGAIDSALNAHAARHFSARDITWMHASYGLGATIGPLLVTELLSGGLTWRWAYGILAVAQAALACVYAAAGGAWGSGPPTPAGRGPGPEGSAPGRRTALPGAFLAAALAFTAVESGIESGAGIWGYLLLSAGRGLSHQAAGMAVSAYWAMMFAGRAILGPVAERVGPRRLLACAVASVPLGTAVMTVPGPAVLAVAGMMITGLAAAPVFPLVTLTTAGQIGAAGATRAVSLQVAASAAGSFALPAGLGLAVEALGPRILAPLLLVLALAMCGGYGVLTRGSGTYSAVSPYGSRSRRSSLVRRGGDRQVPVRQDGGSQQEGAGQGVAGEDDPQRVPDTGRGGEPPGEQRAERDGAEDEEAHGGGDAPEHCRGTVGLPEAANDDVPDRDPA